MKRKKVHKNHLISDEGRKKNINCMVKHVAEMKNQELKVKPEKQCETYVLWLRRGVFNLLDDFPIFSLFPLFCCDCRSNFLFTDFLTSMLSIPVFVCLFSLFRPVFSSQINLFFSFEMCIFFIHFEMRNFTGFSINNSCYGFVPLKPFIGKFRTEI